MIPSSQDCAFRDRSKMGIKEGQLIASRIDAVNWPFGDPVPGSRCSVWLRIVHCFKKSGFYGEHPVGLSPGDDPLRSRLTPAAPINARFHPCILFSVPPDKRRSSGDSGDTGQPDGCYPLCWQRSASPCTEGKSASCHSRSLLFVYSTSSASQGAVGTASNLALL